LNAVRQLRIAKRVQTRILHHLAYAVVPQVVDGHRCVLTQSLLKLHVPLLSSVAAGVGELRDLGLSNALEPPSIDRMRPITRAGQIHLRGSRKLRCCTENADASTSFSQTHYIKPADRDVVVAMGKFEAEIAAYGILDSKGQ
jgi:hypothetical protein